MLRILLAAALSCVATLALAADVAPVGDKAVILPWGDWVVAFLNMLVPALISLLVGAILWVLKTYVPFLGFFISQSLVQRTVQNAVDYATNSIDGAVKGQQLAIPVGSAVIAKATQRVVDQAPGWLLKTAGGPTGVAEKVFRVLHLEAGATAANTLAPALNAIPPGKP